MSSSTSLETNGHADSANHGASSSSSSTSSSPPSTSSSSSSPPSSLSSSPLSSSAAETEEDRLVLFAQSLERLNSNVLIEVMEAVETLGVYCKNLILYPEEKKYRKIKISNIHFQERLGHLSGAIDAMRAIGYIPVGDYLRLDEKKMSDKSNENILKQLEQMLTHALQKIRKDWDLLPVRSTSVKKYVSVLAAGSHSAIGKRHNMEDDEILVDQFCGDEKSGYFGLYDGHGGRATVDFVVKTLHMNLEQHMRRNPKDSLPEAFKQSYLATDGQLRRQNILRSGTTSVTCVIRQVGDKKMLFTANVGDSRAVLCRGGTAVRLTIDHKASLPEEAKRITDAGGFIGRNKRVNGVLAISRALGDHMLKENDVVSAEPYCIAKGTPVAMANGTSITIECVEEGDMVLSYGRRGGKDGVVARRVNRNINKGQRQCVELVFSDGRNMKCTADHRFLTVEKGGNNPNQMKWMEAKDIQLNEMDVITSFNPPLSAPQEDSQWKLFFSSSSSPSSLSLSITNREEMEKSCAFARLLGASLTHSTILSPSSIQFNMEHLLDMESIQRDIDLLSNVDNHRVDEHLYGDSFRITLTNNILSSSLIECRENCNGIPSFLLDPACPSIVIREFLAALVGGQQSLASSSSLSSFLISLPSSSSLPSCSDALLSLFRRAGIDGDLSVFLSHSSSSPSYFIQFPSSTAEEFCRKVGVRHNSSSLSSMANLISSVSSSSHSSDNSHFNSYDSSLSPSSPSLIKSSSSTSLVLPTWKSHLISRSLLPSPLPVFDLSMDVLPHEDDSYRSFLSCGSIVHNCSDTELTAQDTHILLACDGVWDVMTDQEAIDFMLQKLKFYTKLLEEKQTEMTSKGLKLEDLDKRAGTKEEEEGPHNLPLGEFPTNMNEVMHFTAKSLVREALDRRSLDNVTVMVIAL